MEGYQYMFTCCKMPMRAFASGRFTGVQFATWEDCRYIFPSETEISVEYSETSRVSTVCDQKKGYQFWAQGSYDLIASKHKSIKGPSPFTWFTITIENSNMSKYNTGEKGERGKRKQCLFIEGTLHWVLFAFILFSNKKHKSNAFPKQTKVEKSMDRYGTLPLLPCACALGSKF